MATTAHRRTALRASASRRPASLSLASGGQKHPDTSELGDSSVSYVSGTGKARRLLDTEYLWELKGSNAYRKYDQMRFSDPKIAGLRFAQNLPLLRASASIEPAEGGSPNAKGVIENQDAADKAELVQRMLIEDFPWRAFVADTTLSKDYGFAAFEIVWRIEEGEARFRLALRPASSIASEDIFITDGKIDHVIQRPVAGGQCEIPGERLLWFAHCKEGDDFRGRSILRPMYKPWRLKEELEVQLAVLIGKMGGVPVFTYERTLDAATHALLDEAGESFGIAAGAYLKIPEGVTAELMASNAKVAEVLDAIKYWDTELTSVAQAQVLDLGVGQVGSRALGTTMLDMFNDSIQADASYREDVINAKGSLIHQIVTYNFPNDDNLPKLRFGNVQAADIKAMAQAFLWLSQAGMSFNEATWDWVRAEMNLPENDDTQVEVPGDVPAEPQPPAAPEPPAAPPAPVPPVPAKGTPEAGGAQASEAPNSHDTGLQLAERRPARGVEVYLNLAELTQRFDDAKTAVREATQSTRDALAKELAKRAAVAAAKGDLAKFADGKPPMVNRLTDEITAVLRDFYDAGQQQVQDELARQKSGTPWSADTVGNRIAAAEPLSPQRIAKDAALAQQAEMAGRSLALATQAAAANAAARTTAGVPVSEEVMQEAITRESDAAALRFTGIVSDAMQMGRADEAQAQSQDIEDAVYSALLDGAVCDTCAGQDGDVTTDISMAEEWTPNPDCEGGDRCRCLTVYEIAQDQGASA